MRQVNSFNSNKFRQLILNFAALPAENRVVFGNRIVGGGQTTIDQFPYQVSIRKNGDHTCGGSIILPQFVLSAAHCFSNPTKPKSYLVLAGSTNRWGDENQQLKKIKWIKVHGKYDDNSMTNDIAILSVESEFVFNTYVQPVKLPNLREEPKVGSVVTVSGWGAQQEDVYEGPEELHCVDQVVVDTKKCHTMYHGQIAEGMVCAGAPDGGKDACDGDSGGPLTLNKILIGIVSWGEGCGRKDYPGVYTLISNYITWIQRGVTDSDE